MLLRSVNDSSIDDIEEKCAHVFFFFFSRSMYFLFDISGHLRLLRKEIVVSRPLKLKHLL